MKEKALEEIKYDSEKKIKDIFKKCGITEREKQIIKLLKKGYENKEIGVILDITENTVKNHLTNIYRKTGTDSRTTLLKKLDSKE